MKDMHCMVCWKEKCDQPTGAPEEDEYGDWWTYCADCDAWTSHPPEAAEAAKGKA